jgi:hypothetical protein
MSENLGLAVVEADAEDVEERFFARGAEEDRLAREQLRQRLAAMPRWPGLGWAIALLALAVMAAAVLLVV